MCPADHASHRVAFQSPDLGLFGLHVLKILVEATSTGLHRRRGPTL
jgi:hypothetical protein